MNKQSRRCLGVFLAAGLGLSLHVAAPSPARAADSPGGAAAPAATAQPAPSLVLDVWPGAAPDESGKIGPEKSEQKPHGPKPITLVTNVTKPTLSVYRPARGKDTGAAVVICPGGGYSVLAWDLEGTEVAEWLNSIGVTGIVLKYRVPKRADDPKSRLPLQDAQRAMRIVRSKASAWGIDPKRIGMLGFSAGGNLTAKACTNYQESAYKPIDDADKESCRPDFGVLVYPAWLIDDKTGELSPAFPVDAHTPQMFLAHAGDDGISSLSSVGMYTALKKAKVPAELHVYATGGHGFGLRPTDKPCSTWPLNCGEWMKSQGLLKKE